MPASSIKPEEISGHRFSRSVKLYFGAKAVFFLLAGMFFVYTNSPGQQHFGVHYHARSDSQNVNTDMSLLEDMDIQSLMVDARFPEEQLTIISRYDFELTAYSSFLFPTQYRLQYPGEDFLEAVNAINTRFDEQYTAQNVVLFRHGAVFSSRFRELLGNLIEEIGSLNNRSLTYIAAQPPPEEMEGYLSEFIYEINSARDLENFENYESLAGIYYRPGKTAFDLRDFQNLMEKLNQHREVPVFIDWAWFLQNVTKDPLIAEVIGEFSTNPDAVFPNPPEEAEEQQANTLILILLLLWGSFIAHYVFVPTYQKSLIRYFTGHSFFVGDIIYRRIRIGFPNVIVLFQQGIIAGIFINGLLYHYLGELGRQAITHNLVFLNDLPGPLFTFIIAMAVVILLNLLFICWIYLVHRHLQSMNQIATILLWPQHLNLIIISALMALLAAGISGYVISGLVILYLVILFGSFLMATIDASRFIYIRFYYFPLTIGLYLIALVLLYIYILSGSGYINAWELASNLS